jgi:hypothetical protein
LLKPRNPPGISSGAESTSLSQLSFEVGLRQYSPPRKLVQTKAWSSAMSSASLLKSSSSVGKIGKKLHKHNKIETESYNDLKKINANGFDHIGKDRLFNLNTKLWIT